VQLTLPSLAVASPALKALPSTALRCMEEFPPPLESGVTTKLVATAFVDTIFAANEWEINVFDVTPDDCVLLMERMYAELGLVKVTWGLDVLWEARVWGCDTENSAGSWIFFF